MLKVLGRANSINVRKVLWTADELGLAYEREDWGTGFKDARSQEFLTLNPNGQVPVIEDDGFVLWESNAIMRYLCERRGDQFLRPVDLHTRALSEQWLAWQAAELNPAWVYTVMALFRKAPGFDDPAMIEKSISVWRKAMGILEDQLEKTGGFVTGNDFTLADIALGLSVHRWFSIEFEKPRLDAVADYYVRLRKRPGGARYMHETTP